MDYLRMAVEQENYVIGMRREFHRFPEVSSKEERTVERICEELERMGVPYVNVPNGGVIGFIGDEKKGRTVLLRADIDALPGKESLLNGGGQAKPVVSENEDASHTCGHDAHAAILLGAAKALKAIEEQVEGRIILLFERGEEGTGNLVYLHKQLFDDRQKIDSSFALHVFPMMPTGTITVFEGACMAFSLGFKVTIIGKTAHGSEPTVGISPIDCFVAMYGGIQTLRMKHASPFNPMVFSVGYVNAGAVSNIIPGDLTFGGTFRLYDYDDGVRLHNELVHVVEKTAEAYHCRVEHTISQPGFGLVNDEACSQFARASFEEAFGSDTLYKSNPLMGSESHSTTARLWPGTYIGIGIRNEELGITAGNHHECFDVDEDALKTGVASHLCYALEFLKKGPSTEGGVYTGSIRSFYEKYAPRGLNAFDE